MIFPTGLLHPTRARPQATMCVEPSAAPPARSRDGHAEPQTKTA